MADGTSVGGIVAPVQADITDFMRKFDQVNEKTNVVSNNIISRLDMISRALHDVGAQGLDLKIPTGTTNELSRTLQMTDGIKQSKQQIAAIDRNLFEQLQKNNGMENTRTGELRRQKSEIEGQLGALKTQKEVHDSVGKSIFANNAFLQQMKGHLTWMATGGAVMALIGAPAIAIKTIADVEQQMAGMLQTLPSLYLKTADGIQTHTVNQAALNSVTQQFIGIASQYGFEVDKVVEAGKLWSRGYKDVGDVMKLTGVSTKLAIADMMDVTLANRAVEATVSGYKRQGDAVAFSNHIVDSFTNVAHNAQSSATDLAESLLRSASAANVVGISFDTVTALASTMIKNTGQSGAIVGNSLKNIFSTLDSKKGRAALEDLGIGMYKLDTDGTKHLRNMENVIVDIMLAVSGTNKSLQKDFEGLSSKFQWGRAAALFGDYAEFIKNYNLSINSAGVADQQVQAQLDTINRKVEQIKANMTGALMGPASAGLGQYIKDWLDGINMFVKGLQQVPTEAFVVIGKMTEVAVSIFAVSKFIGLLSAGFAGLSIFAGTSAVALEVEAVAATEAAVATTALGGAVTFATGGLNLVLAAIIAAGIGATIYATNVGEAVNAIDKERQATADSIATKESQIAMNAKQTEFIGTLGNAYVNLQEKLVGVQGDEAKTAEINKNIGATHEELAKIVGKTTADRVLASDDIKGAITQEQKVHAQKATEMQSVMDDLVGKQRALTSAAIDECNERIKAINHEADATYTAAQSISASLGMISGAMYSYYKGKAESATQSANTLEAINAESANMPWYAKVGMALNNSDLNDAGMSTNTEELRQQANQANANAAAIEQKAKTVEESKKLTLMTDLYKRGTGGNTRTGGDVVSPDSPGKTKGAGGNNVDPTQSMENRLQRDGNQEKKNDLLLQAKISADNYATALDDVTVKESLFGVTTATTAERAKVKTDRVVELIGEQKKYSDQMDDLHAQADKERESLSGIEDQLDLNGVAFKNLTKVQKQEMREASTEWKMHESTIKELGKEWDNLAEHASTAGKTSKKIANEAKIEAVKAQQDEYNKQFQNTNYDKESGILSLGRNYSKEQADVIELTAAVKNLYSAKEQLIVTENQYGKDSTQYKQQLITVGQLTNQIDTLNDKTLIVRTSTASMFDGMMRGTSIFQDFWKNACLDFGTQMLNQIWNINQAGSQSSILGQMFGGIFGGSKTNGTTANITAKASSASQYFPSTAFRESGGPVTAGQSYIVGEKRPELFVPNTNGSIIPDLSTVRTGGNNSSNGSNSNGGGDTYHTTSVAFNPTFVSPDPAANMKQFKQQMPMFKAEIIKAMKNDPSMRNAVSKAAT